MGSNFCTRLIISLSRKLNIFGDNIVKKIQLICRLSNRLKYTAFYVDAKKNQQHKRLFIWAKTHLTFK